MVNYRVLLENINSKHRERLKAILVWDAEPVKGHEIPYEELINAVLKRMADLLEGYYANRARARR